jgi:hypothetical protein
MASPTSCERKRKGDELPACTAAAVARPVGWGENEQSVRLAGGWCWFVLREEYCWLVAGGWFVLREKYCWLVADRPNEKRNTVGSLAAIYGTVVA